MKPFALFLLAAIFALSFFSQCTPTPDTASSEQAAFDPNASNNMTEPGDSVPPDGGGKEEEAVEKDFSTLGFELLKTEGLGELKLGMEPKQVEVVLGKPTNLSKPEVWEADGMTHQTWTYKKGGLELDMSGNSAAELVLGGITAYKPCNLKTKRQIGIGTPMNLVMEAYKKEIDRESSDTAYIVVGSVYGGVLFTLKNQQVSGIFIGAAAE